MGRSLWPNEMVIRNDAKWNASESWIQMNGNKWINENDWNADEWF